MIKFVTIHTVTIMVEPESSWPWSQVFAGATQDIARTIAFEWMCEYLAENEDLESPDDVDWRSCQTMKDILDAADEIISMQRHEWEEDQHRILASELVYSST